MPCTGYAPPGFFLRQLMLETLEKKKLLMKERMKRSHDIPKGFCQIDGWGEV